MPVAVFAVGCGMGTETYSADTLINMVVVTTGVAIASYGEINFVVIGVVLQLLSVMTESTRLTMVRHGWRTCPPCPIKVQYAYKPQRAARPSGTYDICGELLVIQCHPFIRSFMKSLFRSQVISGRPLCYCCWAVLLLLQLSSCSYGTPSTQHSPAWHRLACHLDRDAQSMEAVLPLQVQILLQRRGLTLNPITTMYYIAPASLAFLSVPWGLIEVRRLWNDPSVKFDALIFISNAAAAFGLNMSVFLLIGKTSALTMNVAGVIKDWLLIGLSVLLFHAEVRSRPVVQSLPCNSQGRSCPGLTVSKRLPWSLLEVSPSLSFFASFCTSQKPHAGIAEQLADLR